MTHAPDRSPKGRADNDRGTGAAPVVRLPSPLRPSPASAAKRLTAEGSHVA